MNRQSRQSSILIDIIVSIYIDSYRLFIFLIHIISYFVSTINTSLLAINTRWNFRNFDRSPLWSEPRHLMIPVAIKRSLEYLWNTTEFFCRLLGIENKFCEDPRVRPDGGGGVGVVVVGVEVMVVGVGVCRMTYLMHGLSTYGRWHVRCLSQYAMWSELETGREARGHMYIESEAKVGQAEVSVNNACFRNVLYSLPFVPATSK
jgi:hypothetical protein